MKHFIRIAWVLASVLLLCLTSCLNEAGDPNSGEDQLPSNVATLSEQVAAMKSSVADIELVQTALSEADGLQGFAAQFEACATSVKEHIANVESGLSGVTAVMTTLKLQGKIAQAAGALKAYVSLQADSDALKNGINALEKGVASWLGKDFGIYYGVAAEKARLESVLAVAQSQFLSVDAIASDVEAGLRVGDASGLETLVETVGKNVATLVSLTQKITSLASEVEQGYASAIKSEASSTKATLKALNTKAAAAVSETGTTLADLASRISACEAALADIDARLEKVEADVNALLGMIQSVSFMSEYAEDYAYAYYDMDLNKKVANDDLPYYGKAQRTATGTMELTYMVRPASAAKALNANVDAINVVGYYAKAAISTKAPLASDYIDFEVTKVAVVNENRGLVTVSVKPNLREAFYYFEIGAKCALSIKNEKTDVMSNFVELYPKENSNRVYVYSVTPSRDYIVIKKGESTSLTAEVYPGDVSTPGCYFASSNSNVVTYDESTGQIIAKEVGEATITITSKGTDEWGLPVTATCGVKVEEAITLTGQRYVEVGYTADMFLEYPKTAIIESKVWSTSDPSKLAVDQNGTVTGVASTYNTTTKAYAEVTVSCTVNGVTTVSWPMYVAATQPKKLITANLAENQSEIQVRVNESLSLASTIYPENVPAGAYKIIYQSDQGLGWINYDTGVIDANRNTYATTAWVTITVENYDKEQYYITDSRVKRVIAVKVIPYYVKTISLNDVEIEIGQAAVTLSPTLTSDVAGKAPTNSALTWTSSNEAIATVDQNGKVTPVAPGNATITATAQDGSGVSGSCTVTVTQPWKEFNVGDYVVRKNLTKEIEFYSDLTVAQSAGYVVGIVISKTNPRATDTMLPASCTHGIAIAMGEGTGKWWSDSYHANATTVATWAAQNGYAFVADGNQYSGYTNTLALKAYIAAHSGLSSGVVDAFNSYNNNGPGLPNGTSPYYIPSAPAMKDVAKLSNMSWAFADKIQGAGGVRFTNSQYWTVSETGTTMATSVNPLTGNAAGSQKTSDYKLRYVFAF